MKDETYFVWVASNWHPVYKKDTGKRITDFKIWLHGEDLTVENKGKVINRWETAKCYNAS